MHKYIIESLLLGLSVGPICLAYCSPVVVPLMSSSDDSKFSFNSFKLLSFLAGRLLGYFLVGVTVGIVGTNFNMYIGKNIYAIISILTGLTLLYFSIQKNFPELKICRIIKNYGAQSTYTILLGFLTGLNLCPPFLAAIVGAAGTGSILGSIIYFISFFAGTVVFFPVMIFFGLLSRFESVKSIANICMLISGIWFLFKGALAFI